MKMRKQPQCAAHLEKIFQLLPAENFGLRLKDADFHLNLVGQLNTCNKKYKSDYSNVIYKNTCAQC